MAKERTITIPSTTTTVSKQKIREAVRSVIRERDSARSEDPRASRSSADKAKPRKSR
jgi:hypothetical protein